MAGPNFDCLHGLAGPILMDRYYGWAIDWPSEKFGPAKRAFPLTLIMCVLDDFTAKIDIVKIDFSFDRSPLVTVFN